MSDKEVLAELKKSYEYLYDIRENACYDHCTGQIDDNINLLEQAIDNIVSIYGDFYKTLDVENLRVKSLESANSKVYINECVDGDYKELNCDTHEEIYFTCGDVNYYWYDDNKFLD